MKWRDDDSDGEASRHFSGKYDHDYAKLYEIPHQKQKSSQYFLITHKNHYNNKTKSVRRPKAGLALTKIVKSPFIL